MYVGGGGGGNGGSEGSGVSLDLRPVGCLLLFGNVGSRLFDVGVAASLGLGVGGVRFVAWFGAGCRLAGVVGADVVGSSSLGRGGAGSISGFVGGSSVVVAGPEVVGWVVFGENKTGRATCLVSDKVGKLSL